MLAQYAVDVMIVILVLLIGLNGFRRGLRSSAALVMAKVVSVIAALLLHEPLLNTLDALFSLKQRISPEVTNLVSHKLIRHVSMMPSDYLEHTFNNVQDYLANQLATAITSYVLKIASFLLLILILNLLFSLLITSFIRPLSKDNFLASLDKGAGFVISSLCAIFIIALFTGLTEPFWPAFPQFDTVIRSSVCFDPLMKVYTPCIQFINSIFGNIFLNPIDSLPSFESLQI